MSSFWSWVDDTLRALSKLWDWLITPSVFAPADGQQICWPTSFDGSTHCVTDVSGNEWISTPLFMLSVTMLAVVVTARVIHVLNPLS